MEGAAAAPRGTGRLAVLEALRYREFRRLWLALLVSHTGDWMQITGRAFLVYAVTGSTVALGVVYLFSYAPQLVFSLLGGALADRFDRRRLVIIGETVQLSLAALLGVIAATDHATLGNIAAISFVFGITQTVIAPAGMALLPRLVPREALQGAVSLQGISHSATRVVGPLIVGVVIPVLGVAWVFYLNALSFGAVLVVWLVTRVPPVAPAEEPTTWRSIPAGLRFVRRTPTIAVPIVTIAFLSAIGLVYQLLGVAFATDVLAGGRKELGGQYFGFMQAAMGVGAVVAMVGMDRAGRRRPAGTVIGSAAAFSVALMLLSGLRAVGPALVVTGFVGGIHFATSMLIMTIVQHEAPEHLRGRIMSVLMIAWVGIFPFSGLLLGQIASVVGVPVTFLAAGALCLLCSLGLVPFRRHIRLQVEPDAPGSAPIY